MLQVAPHAGRHHRWQASGPGQDVERVEISGRRGEQRRRSGDAPPGLRQDTGRAYGDVLLALSPAGSSYDICLPADEGANLPNAAGLADYDGIALTGSALHLWNREPAVDRQVELAREAYRSGTAFFGSCWGVQVACVAAGGDVRKNPLGREIGIARNIAPTDAGRVIPSSPAVRGVRCTGDPSRRHRHAGHRHGDPRRQCADAGSGGRDPPRGRDLLGRAIPSRILADPDRHDHAPASPT